MNTENYPAIEPYSKNTIKKFTLSAGAALEFGYNLNETWMFGAESFYRKSLLGIYNNENKINQTGSHYGIKLSIKKIF